MTKPMTPESYLEHEGSLCPVCRSDKVRAGGPEPTSTIQVIRGASCETCEATWTDVYGLENYDNLFDRNDNEL